MVLLLGVVDHLRCDRGPPVNLYGDRWMWDVNVYVRFTSFCFTVTPRFPPFVSLSLSLPLSLFLSRRAKRETGRINRGSGRRSSSYLDVCKNNDDDDDDDGGCGGSGCDGNIPTDGKINGSIRGRYCSRTLCAPSWCVYRLIIMR